MTFGYEDQRVLNGVSFTIPEKSLVTLVGPSGSGKTTITKLIARFWDVTTGTIRGGVDIHEIGTERLMEYITFVFQDVFLFNDTILNNIRFGSWVKQAQTCFPLLESI